jgi:hypothetical protein
MAKSFYETIKGLVPASFIDHHESDLYVRDTPLVRAIVRQFGRESRGFTSDVDGQRWLDIPFAYEPFWEKKARGAKKAHAKVKESTHSVSYWVPKERFWQFAGEGSQQWANERAKWLRDRDHKVRIRKL